MPKPMIRIHDLATGEVVDREMNDEEFAQYEESQAKAEAEAQVKAEAEAARASLLAKLGITEEEARLLLGEN